MYVNKIENEIDIQNTILLIKNDMLIDKSIIDFVRKKYNRILLYILIESKKKCYLDESDYQYINDKFNIIHNKLLLFNH